MTPTQRTLRLLREEGRVVDVVERFIAGRGIRRDFLGIIDLIALDPCQGVIGIQSCGNSFSEHWHKLTEEKLQSTRDWLMTPGTRLYIYAWRKVKAKRGGKAMIWSPRIKEITLGDLELPL